MRKIPVYYVDDGNRITLPWTTIKKKEKKSEKERKNSSLIISIYHTRDEIFGNSMLVNAAGRGRYVHWNVKKKFELFSGSPFHSISSQEDHFDFV